MRSNIFAIPNYKNNVVIYVKFQFNTGEDGMVATADIVVLLEISYKRSCCPVKHF